MTKELKQSFYEEQIPDLLVQMKRIADALERQVEMMEQSQAAARESSQQEKAVVNGQREERRKKFEAQLQKLAEVDKMARELRQKLEEKQAAEIAAKAEAALSADESIEKAVESDDDGEAVENPSLPPEN